MAFTRISNSQINSRGATTLPNQPQISAIALKEEFDAPAKQIVAPAVNNLMDELEASTSANSLGAVAPAGRTGTTVQGVINSVSGDLATLEANAGQAIADAHTHANKALLDTYTQTEADLAQAVADDHTHSNKALLDTYTQTETNLADAVSKKHDHSNKSLLDSYTQTESDIADAVSKKHSHSNKALLDTYTQTETDIADAVSKKHTHTNKTVIDKFGEDSGGNPTYDGNPIGGGGSADAYKTIEAGGSSFVASGADTFKINAGSNVTITPLTGDKGIQISATGGGQSTGDMLMSDYDPNGTVKSSTNGITGYVASEIAKIDVDDLHDTSIASLADQDTLVYNGTAGTWGNEPLADVALTGSYASLSNTPTIPDGLADLTDDVAISSPSSGQILQHNGTKWANANMPSIPDGLADLTDDVNISSPSNDQVLKYDGSSSKWVNGSAPASGHTMIPTPSGSPTEATVASTINAKYNTANDESVVSAYSVSRWSNEKKVRRLIDGSTSIGSASIGATGIGTWFDGDPSSITPSTDEADWWQDDAFKVPSSSDDVELSIKFDPSTNEAVTLGGYILDTTTGKICIKFGNEITDTTNAKIAVDITYTRNEVD